MYLIFFFMPSSRFSCSNFSFFVLEPWVEHFLSFFFNLLLVLSFIYLFIYFFVNTKKVSSCVRNFLFVCLTYLSTHIFIYIVFFFHFFFSFSFCFFFFLSFPLSLKKSLFVWRDFFFVFPVSLTRPFSSFFYCSQGFWGFFLSVRSRTPPPPDSSYFLFPFWDHFRPLWYFFFFLKFSVYPGRGAGCDNTPAGRSPLSQPPKLLMTIRSSSGFSYLRPGVFHISLRIHKTHPQLRG